MSDSDSLMNDMDSEYEFSTSPVQPYSGKDADVEMPSSQPLLDANLQQTSVANKFRQLKQSKYLKWFMIGIAILVIAIIIVIIVMMSISH